MSRRLGTLPALLILAGLALGAPPGATVVAPAGPQNPSKLFDAIRSAGLPCDGVNGSGRPYCTQGWTAAQQSQVDAIVSSFDPTPTTAQALAAKGRLQLEAALALRLSSSWSSVSSATRTWAQGTIDAEAAAIASIVPQ